MSTAAPTTLRTVADLRAAVAARRRDGATIGLVPTMGALHEGHLSLIRQARRDCDTVVVSVFVNPAQFNEQADLAAYPRDERRDAQLAADAGAEIVFAPAVEEVYPAGFATTVSVGAITETLEGAIRGRGHFDGVTTVVTKLLNMAAPDIAYFGQKDAQQALVVRRLVRDLDIPVRIEVCPTVRDEDGLALSSRNARLTESERRRATALPRALRAAASALRAGQRDPAAVIELARAELAREGIEPEYLELVDPEGLAPLRELSGPPTRSVLIVLAAQVGAARLIDSALVEIDPTPAAVEPMTLHRPAAIAAGPSTARKRGAPCSARC